MNLRVIVGLAFSFITQIFFSGKTFATEMIVWNVGQGQWITIIEKNECWHFDLGGESSALTAVNDACGQRFHRIYITHWDWDHVRYLVPFLKINQTRTCITAPPQRPNYDFQKKILSQTAFCPKDLRIFEIYRNHKVAVKKRDRNKFGSVFYLTPWRILISGDSPSTMEKKWMGNLSSMPKYFILGHHGSSTSNSLQLINNLDPRAIAIASARMQKYGHPHKKIRQRLKMAEVPLLTTEIFGHIRVQLSP
jgi:competence protein ComEC